jgi:Uma2 family endonuclease
MATVVTAPAEQRILLRNVSWETYERLLAELAECSSPRLTFDRGTLEIMSPSEDHEEANRILASLLDVVIEELDIDARTLGSTTFRREDLERGFEPDSCFYIQNVARVKGKRKIDLKTDPPPDLVIEVDISSSSLDKLSIYGQLGVPEAWRYDGERLTIHILAAGAYHESDSSLAFPFLSAARLTELLEAAATQKRSRWLRSVREWLRASRGREG